jgi:hypothetical protein
MNESSNTELGTRKDQKIGTQTEFRRQIVLYLTFAILMIILNYTIQKTNELFIAPFICENFGSNSFINLFYCIKDPDMSEFIGSVFAVGLTYLIKFTLDKFIVFKRKSRKLKQTSIEFIKYFGFAILTTLLNIGLQFIFTNFFGTPLEISSFTALIIGYTVKFFLDRKFVFTSKD